MAKRKSSKRPRVPSEAFGFDQATESVVARLPIEIDNPGPVRNIAVDHPRRRLWLAISDVGQIAMGWV
jgi:hypothetical protein